MNMNSPRTLLVLLASLNLLNYFDRYVLSSLLEPIKADLHLSDGQLGRVATSFMLGYFLTSPFFGYLGDRFPRRYLVFAGALVWSVATFLTGFAGSLMTLILFRVFVGFGESSFSVVSPAMISDVYGPARRNNALSFFYTAIPFGAALGFLFGGVVGSHFGWRDAFFWAGVPGLALASLLFLLPEPRRGGSDNGKGGQPEKASLRDLKILLKNPIFLLAVGGYSIYTFAMGAYSYWAPSFLTRTYGLSIQQSATFFGAALTVTGVAGTLVGGFTATWLKKRMANGYGLLLGFSMLVAAPLALLSHATSSLTVALTAATLCLFALFFSTGPVNTVIIESCPPGMRATAMAISVFCIHFFGDLWSPEIVGRLSDYLGDLRWSMLLILPTALLVAAILWLWLARKQAAVGAGATTAA